MVSDDHYGAFVFKVLPRVLENMLNFAIDQKIRELKLDWLGNNFIPYQKIKSLPMEIFSVETIKIKSVSMV